MKLLFNLLGKWTRQPMLPAFRMIAFLLLMIPLFQSCSKEDGTGSGGDNTSFEYTLSGALNKTVKGDYALVVFESYPDPVSTKTNYVVTVILATDKNEELSFGVVKEGKVAGGSYPIDITFDPFFSSYSNYTEDNGLNVYEPETGTLNFSSVGEDFLKGSFDVHMKLNGNTLNAKGKFYAKTK